MAEDKAGEAGKFFQDHVALKLPFIIDKLLKAHDMSALSFAFAVSAVIGAEQRIACREKFAHHISVPVNVLGIAVNDVHHCFDTGRIVRRPPLPVDGCPVLRFEISGLRFHEDLLSLGYRRLPEAPDALQLFFGEIPTGI
jgi:hypothetical protein